METEKRNNIYDSVRVGLRGLTVIIALGLILLGILMAYGYYLGQNNTSVTREAYEVQADAAQQ